MENACSSRVKGQLMLYGKLLKYPIYNSSVRGQIFLCFTSLGVFLCIRLFYHFTPAKKLASKEKGFGGLGPFRILMNLPPFWGTGVPIFRAYLLEMVLGNCTGELNSSF